MLNSLLQFIGQAATEQVLYATAYTAFVALLGLALGLLLNRRPDLRDEAQLVANYTEATEALIKKVAVVAAEQFGLKVDKHGIDKTVFALDVVEEAFAKVGIKGDPERVGWGTLIADIKLLARELFPPKLKAPDKPAA